MLFIIDDIVYKVNKDYQGILDEMYGTDKMDYAGRMKQGQTTIIHIANVDVALRNEFKALCARKGLSMREVLLRFIVSEVKRVAGEAQ
jgi:predicted transposase YdaD